MGRYFMLDDKQAAIKELAPKIWSLSRDRLLVNLRFLDAALSGLKFQPQEQSGEVCCDLNAPQRAVIYYDPPVVVHLYKKNPANVTRLYLHILLHCIFSHSYKYDKVEQELWDVAADMAVENATLGLKLSGLETAGTVESACGDPDGRENLQELKS